MPRKKKEEAGDEEILEIFEPEADIIAPTSDEDDISTPPGNTPSEPMFKGLLDALDNEDAKAYFFSMMGYMPAYDEKGHFIGYVKRKEPDFDDQLVGFLSAIRSGKVMAIADMEDIEPLTPLEVEWTVEVLQELILLQAPPDVDIMSYLVPMEWAKLEMKKNMSLAKGGRVINALLGVPVVGSEGPTFVEPPAEREVRKTGLLGKLLGRD